MDIHSREEKSKVTGEEKTKILPGTEVRSLRFLAPAMIKALKDAGIGTVQELLARLPARFEDREHILAVTGPTVEPIVVKGVVLSSRLRRFGGKNSMFDLTVEDAGEGGLNGVFTVRWFQMPFLQKVFAVGRTVLFYGRLKEVKGGLQMEHPEWEPWEDTGGDPVHMARITPVYRLKSGLKQKSYRSLVHRVLDACHPEDWPDLLREPSGQSAFRGMTRLRALREAHFPEDTETAGLAGRYLALEEFYRMQIQLLGRRARVRSESAPPMVNRSGMVRNFLSGLGFALTEGQKLSLREILTDLKGTAPMRRLLQGDVGSGKTVVALAAMVRAVESGKQAALMAPTQILAEQHYALCQKWLEPMGIKVGFRSGRAKAGDTGLPGLMDRPDVWVGTHALLYDGWDGSDLGLVVIDEQHRFGVEQRSRLLARGQCPHVLVMTATPIPRTLMLTLHGDMDVSVITDKPPGRGVVRTHVRGEWKEKEIASWLKSQLEEGRQAYLVYPLVEESASLDVAAATEALGRWEKFLSPASVGLLTGRTKADEKERVMRAFRAGEIQALVATQVIEVGVDVPNASCMLIFHAERFGLAQLHQLRGRVGRGGADSWCLLFPGKTEDPDGTLAKLNILERTDDGFQIAEEDLKRRGPGDVLGRMQSGFTDHRFVAHLGDTRLLHTARKLAEETLAEDPRFELPRNQPLRALWETESQEAGEG